DLASKDELPPLARAVLENGYLPVSEVLKIDRAIARSAQELYNPLYRGRMGSLWRESKALEMMVCLLDRLADGAPAPTGLSARELSRVREAHEFLLSDLRSPPGLQVLAE